ncbi:MAG: tRNA pseudouridine synthase A [Candidatus Tokpelaia hoelldobleri]|uniref:tRNA pseudouridine synthase A n=1 Tax=Candidatus Tokpelaia hoelldobleri TaxID=1902579 RepID=A0A1U9JSH2_9HYPH|nr:MAG: tRNA pseudouridine synthase A [Candidatus Tokpelaia hoelldoblerii]
MPRYKLTIEYDGTPYAGWQRQAGLPSVQGVVETAIARFCSAEVTITTAGRTDAGVHASAQTVHVDLERDWPADKVRDALNAHLSQAGEAVSVLTAERVAQDFDARFSALRRHYLYRILNRRSPAALDARRVWWVPRPLDAEKMHEAAQRLIGYHDFTTFRATQCQAKSPLRSLDVLDVTRHGEMIEIRASARSFLHNQIRSFAGSLAEVGFGRWTADDLQAALEARDRARCGMVAPPYGLYLIGVDYA